MASADRHLQDEALDWVRRLYDPSFADWDAHIAWLEADPRHPAAFDEASLMIEAATVELAPPRPLATSPIPINDNLLEPIVPSRRWTRWGAGLGIALAAGVAAVVAVPSLMQAGAQPFVVHTAPGEKRVVTIDGTSIALNGDSSLRLDRINPRVAVLERGEAFFTVRHDAAHPFAVQAGGARFQDVGTAFDIVARADVTQIAVREGAVLYDPGGAAVRLDGGQSLRIADNSATVRTVDAAAVGGWRSGQLLYRDASLGDVAQDVARSIGEPVAVDPALTVHRFSGVVMIDADRPRMFRRMAAVMGVHIRRVPQGWQMVLPSR